MKTFAFVLLAVAVVAFAGCKKDGEGSSPAVEKGPSPEQQLKAFDEAALSAVQAAVPADGPKVVFEARLVDKERVLAAVPAGWVESPAIPGLFKPPEGSDLGFMTKYSVGSTCGGSCVAKDWRATSDKDMFAQFQGEQFELVKDEALTDPTGRLLVATADGGRRAFVAVARWKDDASRYYSCNAALDEPALALRLAIEQACAANVALFLQ